MLLLTGACSLSFGQEKFDLVKDYAISGNATLYLQSNDAKVNIGVSENDRVYLEIHRHVSDELAKSQKFGIEVENKDGNVYINEIRSNTGLKWWNSGKILYYNIDILVPHGVSLRLNGYDDDYNITGLDAELHIETEDGDIVLTDCKLGTAKIRCEDGDLNIHNCSGSFDINAEDGDVTSNLSRFEGLKIRVEDGDIVINDGSSENVQLTSSDGDISLAEVYGSIEARTEDGSIRIKYMETESSRIKSEDGDIHVRLNCGDNAAHEFVSEDGDIILALEGNASIHVKCDDSDVDIDSRNYTYKKNSENHKVIETIPSGSTYISIKSGDGDIVLKK